MFGEWSTVSSIFRVVAVSELSQNQALFGTIIEFAVFYPIKRL